MQEKIPTQIDKDLSTFIKSDVFTPHDICKIMSSKLNNSGSLLEPSVGIGSLLKFINIDNYNRIDVYELKKEYLTHIINEKINKKNEDFLKAEITCKYDNIIMNPPYIRIQDLSVSYRKYLKENFDELKTGLVDIYYAFILKCMKLLNKTGRMVSITPNSYLYNKSSHKLREYLFENRLVEEIIDFNDKKVFKKVSVYCCISIFTKSDKEYLIYNNKKISYNIINKNYSLFNHNDTLPENTLKNICKISNGIATLRDKIFIHPKKIYDEPCWEKITNGNDVKYIIYPYTAEGKILDETIFKTQNSKTYEYLLKNKNELAKRDKGNKTYPAWYSFGRTQALIKSQKPQVIYISTFINPENFKLNIMKPELFHSCLCIEPFNNKDIGEIKEAIYKNIEYIKKLSSKRSGGWINLSSSILYKIPLIHNSS